MDKAGQLYIVDWDEALLAPRERDLRALAYYRCERILADVVATEDAAEMARQFEPGNVVEIAEATYQRYLEQTR